MYKEKEVYVYERKGEERGREREREILELLKG